MIMSNNGTDVTAAAVVEEPLGELTNMIVWITVVVCMLLAVVWGINLKQGRDKMEAMEREAMEKAKE